jgi:hypothetical protein
MASESDGSGSYRQYAYESAGLCLRSLRAAYPRLALPRTRSNEPTQKVFNQMSLWQCVVQHCAASTIGYLAALAVLRMPIEFNLCSNTMTLRYFPCTTCNKIGIGLLDLPGVL